MTRPLLFVASMFFCCTVWQRAAAQDSAYKFELSVGYGYFSSDRMFDGVTGGVLSPKLQKYTYNSYSGTPNVSIAYIIGLRVRLGLIVACERESGDWLHSGLQGRSTIDTYTIGTFKRQVLTLAPELTVNYREEDGDDLMIYSTYGLGVTFSNEVDTYSDKIYYGSFYNGSSTLGPFRQQANNRVHLNGYYSPIGLRLGNRQLSGFLQLGIGYKGIICGGLMLKL